MNHKRDDVSLVVTRKKFRFAISEQPQQTHDATPQHTATVYAFAGLEARDTDTVGQRDPVTIMVAFIPRVFQPARC